ncbi:MAG: hypothetical protein P8X96_18830 [Desulfobacteraceae bacterium]
MDVKYTRTFCLALFTWCIMLLGCSQNNVPVAGGIEKSKENDMAEEMEQQAVLPIPPIDAAAPEEFQTASFGLG